MTKKEKSALRKVILEEEMKKNLIRRKAQKKEAKENNLDKRKNK